MCEQSVMNRTMFSQQGQYYFTIPEEHAFKPDFPEKFDTLIIEHNGKECSIPRNKIIDRFIKKATVYTIKLIKIGIVI